MKRSKKEEPEVEVKEEAPEPNALASAAAQKEVGLPFFSLNWNKISKTFAF